MTYYNAKRIFKEYGFSSKFLSEEMDCITEWDQKRHRKLNYIFKKIRDAAYVIESRSALLGHMGWDAWSNPEKEGEIIKNIYYKAFWYPLWEVGFISENIKNTLIAVEDILGTFHLTAKSVRKYDDKRNSIYEKVRSLERDSVALLVHDPLFRSAAVVTKSLKDVLPKEITINYNYTYISFSALTLPIIQFSDKNTKGEE